MKVHCTNCGIKINEADKFCSICGHALHAQVATGTENTEKQNISSITSELAHKPELLNAKLNLSTIIYIFVAIGVFGSLVAAMSSEKVVPQTYTTIAFGSGILAALSAKKRGKSGILWFVIGFIVIGIGAAFLIGFITAILRH